MAGLTQTDAVRLGRVIGALAATGLIDKCYVFVRAPEPGSEAFESWLAVLTDEPTPGTRRDA